MAEPPSPSFARVDGPLALQVLAGSSDAWPPWLTWGSARCSRLGLCTRSALRRSAHHRDSRPCPCTRSCPCSNPCLRLQPQRVPVLRPQRQGYWATRAVVVNRRRREHQPPNLHGPRRRSIFQTLPCFSYLSEFPRDSPRWAAYAAGATRLRDFARSGILASREAGRIALPACFRARAD